MNLTNTPPVNPATQATVLASAASASASSASSASDLAQSVLMGEAIEARLGQKLSALDDSGGNVSASDLLGLQQDTAQLSVLSALVAGVTKSLTDTKKDLLLNL
jgi:hypothetical protein